MTVTATNGFIESYLAQRLLPPPTRQPQAAQEPQAPASARDVVRLSANASNGDQSRNARLIRETEEETENGIRITQEFETAEGRAFTRIQDFAVTSRGFQRNVIQQNPSGSTTQIEEVLNRQEDGLFQRIQRFTNEVGETQTRIDNDYVSLDLFVVSNGAAYGNGPLNTARGTQLDLQV